MCTFRTHSDCLLTVFSWCCGQVQSPLSWCNTRLKGHCGIAEQYPSPPPPRPHPTHHITKVSQQWFPQYQETLLLTYNWLVSSLGVLFSKATHYLPLNFTREDKTKLVDMRANATGMVFGKINVTTAEQIGQVLSLNGKDNYIELNNLKDECITNPSNCAEGLSVAFWIKYTEGK